MSRTFEPRPGFTVQAYQFALEPTEQQAEQLRSNWGLARVKANPGRREAERSYGVPDDQRTPTVNWSAYSLRTDWNAAKREVAPWWAENSGIATGRPLGPRLRSNTQVSKRTLLHTF